MNFPSNSNTTKMCRSHGSTTWFAEDEKFLFELVWYCGKIKNDIRYSKILSVNDIGGQFLYGSWSNNLREGVCDFKIHFCLEISSLRVVHRKIVCFYNLKCWLFRRMVRIKTVKFFSTFMIHSKVELGNVLVN